MADNMMRIAGRDADGLARALSVELDNDGMACMRVVKAAEVAYNPEFLTDIDVFQTSQQSKMAVTTVINNVTVAAGKSTYYDFLANGADEIYFIIAINKFPWSASASCPWVASTDTYLSSLYPMRKNVGTSHVSFPLRSMFCLPSSGGDSTVEHLSFDDAYKQRASCDGRIKVTNEHATDDATVTVKILRVWRG